MAIKAIKKKKEYKYIPVIERNEDKPLTFIFRPLTKSEQAKLEDSIMNLNPTSQSITLANSSYILNAILITLKEVKNLLDENGKELTGEINMEFLENIPDDILQEFGNVVISVSKDPQNADKYLGEV